MKIGDGNNLGGSGETPKGTRLQGAGVDRQDCCCALYAVKFNHAPTCSHKPYPAKSETHEANVRVQPVLYYSCCAKSGRGKSGGYPTVRMLSLSDEACNTASSPMQHGERAKATTGARQKHKQEREKNATESCPTDSRQRNSTNSIAYRTT